MRKIMLVLVIILSTQTCFAVQHVQKVVPEFPKNWRYFPVFFGSIESEWFPDYFKAEDCWDTA